MRREIGFKDSSIDLNMINSNGQRFFSREKKGSFGTFQIAEMQQILV